MKTFELLLVLLSSKCFGESLNGDIIGQIDGDKLLEIYNISKAHDVSHIVGSALSKNNMLGDDDISKKFKKQMFLAYYRYERINYAFDQICELFENEKIIFVPLKGSIIRDMYPEPWMRMSCDIDILVHEADIDKATKILTDKAGFSVDGEKNYHDISLFSSDNVHLELHFSIKEAQDNIDLLLSKVWDYCIPTEENKYRYKFTNEYFIFHQIAHMSYHFLNGGCGIKPFMDLRILNEKFEYDAEKVRQLCKECNIDTFYDNVTHLTNVWFGNEEHTELTLKMQSFLISGGVYGTVENRISVESKRKGGKLSYAVKRVFMPYTDMKKRYPILEKYWIMLPICHVMRWCKLLSKGKFERSVKELGMIKNADLSKSDATDIMLKELGL